MAINHTSVALDLGATSGRAILGTFHSDENRLTVEEIHRFRNDPVQTSRGLRWNVASLRASVDEDGRRRRDLGQPEPTAPSSGLDPLGLIEAEHYERVRPVGIRPAPTWLPLDPEDDDTDPDSED